MNAKTLIEKLGLVPLPLEGGYFTETYRCNETIPASALDTRYGKDRSHSTAIYYLLTTDSFSTMHRVKSDEIFHFYLGDPVEMLQLHPDGSHSVVTIGNNIEADEIPQHIVQRGTWQGCRLKDGGEYALMGTTVAPAFDYEDYKHGDRQELIAMFPECADMIEKLTRE